MGSPRCVLMLLLHILIQDYNRSLLTSGKIGKPGKCQKIKVWCHFRENDECYLDRDCMGPQKCCQFSCGWKCLDPKKDPCLEKVKVISCSDYIPRFYYSIKDRKCYTFKDSSCSSLKNSFQSRRVCEKTCSAYGKIAALHITPAVEILLTQEFPETYV
ncbi:eppin-like [Macrotis lagotis]|uniref:eppin-like n=1 Tax=Macrotis lagotis TaxID=92651 RepID=UPI003D687F83